jgi:dTDP-4-dehydrorhamnose reductase
MMKILIVGAGGQLARCLAHSLVAHELVLFDHAALDITRLHHVRNAIDHHRPNLLINGSAFNQVDAAESQTYKAYAINALGPRNLAVATAAHRIPVLHVSTDYVFNGTASRPYHEFDRTNPVSAYGASKLAGEVAVQTLNARHYIVRTAWLFWEKGKSFLMEMRKRATNGSQLSIANDQFGSPTYVPHLAHGIAQLITTEAYGIYHVAGKGGASRWELVCEFFRLLGDVPLPLPTSRNTFVASAVRPAYSVLTSIQDPLIELPPWQEGLAEFARSLINA